MGYDADERSDPPMSAVPQDPAPAKDGVLPQDRGPATTADQATPADPVMADGRAVPGDKAPDGTATPDGRVMADGKAVPGDKTAAGKSVADDKATAAGKKAERRRRRIARFELPLLIVIAIGIAVVLKTFVVQPFYIPSQSMEQTLHGCPGCTGDRILVFKPVYQLRDPHPGDVVVFRAPHDWDELAGVQLSTNPVMRGVQMFGQLIGVVPPSEKDLVKRVIAVGGQTVRCCDSNGNVEISDSGVEGPWRSLNEPYVFENSSWSKPKAPGLRSADDTRSFGPVTVPDGRLWVMGDHRSDSADSRYHCGNTSGGKGCDPMSSTVGVDDVIGKAVLIAWPPSRWRTIGTPATFNSSAAPSWGGLPAEPAAAAVLLTAGIGGWRHRRRRR